MDTREKNKKHIIILEHEGGRLGNHLLNYISIMAYCLERGYSWTNLTFGKYENLFADTTDRFSVAMWLLSKLPNRINHVILKFIQKYIKKYYSKNIINSGNHIGNDVSRPFYLPPTSTIEPKHETLLSIQENSSKHFIFLSGWLFRNPRGIIKYQEKIKSYLKPHKRLTQRLSKKFLDFRKEYNLIVGVHIRRTDYRKYMNGRLYFDDSSIDKILNDFLKQEACAEKNTLFVMCSDEPVDQNKYPNKNIHVNKGSIGDDFFTLGMTDIIIGSDSTFGAMAAYIGNIPIVFFSHDTIDWSIATQRNFNYYNNSINIQH